MRPGGQRLCLAARPQPTFREEGPRHEDGVPPDRERGGGGHVQGQDDEPLRPGRSRLAFGGRHGGFPVGDQEGRHPREDDGFHAEGDPVAPVGEGVVLDPGVQGVGDGSVLDDVVPLEVVEGPGGGPVDRGSEPSPTAVSGRRFPKRMIRAIPLPAGVGVR